MIVIQNLYINTSPHVCIWINLWTVPVSLWPNNMFMIISGYTIIHTGDEIHVMIIIIFNMHHYMLPW